MATGGGAGDAVARPAGSWSGATVPGRDAALLAHLQAVTAELARTLSVADVAGVVCGHVQQAAAASGVTLALVRGEHMVEVVGSAGFEPEVVDRWVKFSVEENVPIAEAISRGRAVWVESKSERFHRFAVLRGPRVDSGALAAIPLIVDGRVLGALGLAWDDERTFDRAERSFLSAIAVQCAQAVERAHLHAELEDALDASERARAFLDSLVAHAPIGLAFLDGEGRYLRINDVLAEINGAPPEHFLGRTLREALPGLSEDADAAVHQVLESGEPVVNTEISGYVPARPGVLRTWLASYYPVTDEKGSVVAVGAMVIEITDRKRAEEELTRLLAAEQSARAAAEHASQWLEQLQVVTESAFSHSTVDELLDDLLRRVGELLRADSVAILLADDASPELVVRASLGLGDAATPVRIPFGDGVSGRVAATARPMVVDDLSTVQLNTPALSDAGIHALLAVPLLVHGAVVGVMHVGSRVAGRFDEDDTQLLMLIADRIATAIDRARLFDAEHAARAAAEAGQRQLAFLAEASRVLGASLDYETTLQQVAELGTGVLGDLCAIHLFDETGCLRVVAGAHVDPGRAELLQALEGNTPGPNSHLARVVRLGRPLVLDEVTDEDLQQASSSPEHLARTRELQLGPSMLIPLAARGRTVGVLSISGHRGTPPYNEEAVALATEVARRAAIAIDNARLYGAQAEVAGTLQRSLLPPNLPQIPGLDLAARFHPTGEGLEVGGDFYDAFPLADGAWAVMIGDVAGAGARAAATTALVRHTVRAVARHVSGPRAVVAEVDRAMRGSANDEEFVTLLYGEVRPGPGGVELDLASAGHPAPLVLRGSGPIEEIAVRGSLVGGVSAAEVEPVRVLLAPGDALVCFTDGVLEARQVTDEPDAPLELFEGERLSALLRAAWPADAGTLAAAVADAVLAFSGGRAGDDIAVLVLKAT